jgi:hypothetical protein
MAELLIEIWSYTEINDRLAISRVSSKWRSVALAAASMWTLIDLTAQKPALVRKLLERSGISPIHLTLKRKRQDYPFLVQVRVDSDHSRPSSQPKPPKLISQSEVDQVISNCASLDGIIERKSECYISEQTLTKPMPHLRRLNLSTTYFFHDSDSSDSLTEPLVMPFPIFAHSTPLLRDISFDRFHANWADPIYQNLTKISLIRPKSPASPSDILRILTACPDLEHLNLIDCFSNEKSTMKITNTTAMAKQMPEIGHRNDKLTELRKLRHLHVQNYRNDSISDFLSALSTLSLDHLYVGAPAYSGFTDKFGSQIQSVLPTIRHTKVLSIAIGYSRYILRGSLNSSHPSAAQSSRDGTTKDSGSEDLNWTWIYCPRLSSVYSEYSSDETSQDESTKPSMDQWLATLTAIGRRGPSDDNKQLYPVPAAIEKAHRLKTFTLLLEHVSLGGVDLGSIEELEVNDGVIFPDDIYHTVFSRCQNIQRLRMSYNKGVGILTTVVENQLLPRLRELHLGTMEQLVPKQETRYLDGHLITWVENRQRRTMPEERHGIQSLEKIVLQRKRGNDLWDEVMRETIQNALGSQGTFEMVYSETFDQRFDRRGLTEESDLSSPSSYQSHF